MNLEEQQISIEKYLKALVTINSVLGKLDVLRLHVKTVYKDEMSTAIIESIINDLSNVSGVDYKTINTDNIKAPVNNNHVQYVYNTEYPTPPKPCTVEIIEDNAKNKSYNNYNDDLASVNFANANLTAQKVINKVQQQRQQRTETQKEVNKTIKTINPSQGIQLENNNKLFYNFVNSNTLDFAVYDKECKNLTITFAKNGRIYEYYNIPVYMFQNLANVDEMGKSAGSYFQQNIARNKNIQYKEITDNVLIG